MERSSSTLRSLLCLLALGAPAAAQTTWIVDDDGGTGVHFSDVQSALFAAAPGDLILVADGEYDGFVVRRSVRLLAESGARVTSRVQVLLVSGPLPVVLAGFSLQKLELLACASTVALVDLELGDDLTLTSCADVRGLDLSSAAAGILADVRTSRLELVRSTLVGRAAPNVTVCGGYPEAGESALLHASSTLLVSNSSLSGGRGGNAHTFGCLSTCAAPGGDGGNGLEGVGSVVVVTGNGTAALSGGEGGWGCGDGSEGACLDQTGGALRLSGTPCTSGASTSGTVVTSPSLDPSLLIEGAPAPGGTIDLVVHGLAGQRAELSLGRAPVVLSGSGSAVERLVSTGRLIPLGPLPGGGVVRLQLTLPSAWPAGTLFWLQASAVDAAGQPQLTNSVPLLLR